MHRRADAARPKEIPMKLKKSDRFPQPTGPVVQIIMDGLGIAPPGPGNAVAAAFIPTLAWLQRHCPRSEERRGGKECRSRW